MQAASAESELWYSYPGFQSTWHCNTTGTFALNSGEGYAYVQACEVLNGSYYQGLVNVSFSQAHSDVSINVANASSLLPESGVRTCYGGISSGERSCFAHRGALPRSCCSSTSSRCCNASSVSVPGRGSPGPIGR